MANFFKEYHAQLKETRQAAETANTQKQYEAGQAVKIDKAYCWDGESNKKYFVTWLPGDCVLLADSKKEAVNGYGHIYSASVI
jgi:hypothetical protein